MIEAYRVLRDDGILFLTLPDKRRTFDHHRFITPIDHFEADHFHPSESMDFIHFMESASTTYSDSYIDQLTLAKEQFIEKYPIHYHTFVMENALGLLNL